MKIKTKKRLTRSVGAMVLCLSLFASSTMAENLDIKNSRISLNNKNATVEEILKDIENQTEYLFIYNNKFDLNRKMSISTDEQNISEVLDKIFSNTDITYVVNGKNIVLVKKNDVNGQAVAQQRTKKITGVVKDSNGEALIGVNVFVKGTNIGTVTDANGNFVLDVPAGKQVEVSYMGYITQNLNTDKRSNFEVVLADDTQALDEVVVVGFGTQKKVNLSGSVSSVNLEKAAQSRPITNLSSALAGAATGLNVTSASNRPGSDDATLLIRGVGTLNNSSPLIIIDGAEGTLSDININDVESISVLKDASSSAIYGSRAANGVILVTTKSGKSGKVKVGYNGYVSFQTARKGILEPVSNYADFMEYINEGYTNSGVAAPYSESSIQEWRSDNGKNPLKYPNVNWLEESFRTGVGNNHTLSIQGGNEAVNTYTSIGYYNNPGIMENNGYKRYHVLSNVTANVAKWLTIGLNLNGYQGNSELGSGSFGWAWATSPAMILRYNGKYGGMQDSQADVSESVNNMLASQNSANGYNITRAAKARGYFTITPIKDLSITGSMVYDYNENRTKTTPVFYDYWNFSNNTIVYSGAGQTYVNQTTDRYQRNYMDIVAKYGHRFLSDKLGLNVLVGASQEQYIYEYETYQRKDLLDGSLSVINGANGAVSATGNRTSWAMRSYFGRINLDWDNKYLAEFNLRSDGSSRFLSDNRWGWFPSFSLGWRISEEDFMKDINWIDNLKLRGSYGSLGNNSVGNYAARSTYSNKTYVVNGVATTGWAVTYLANPLLTWESTKVTDLGLDFGVLNNRLTGTLDYFNKKTDGILISLPVPYVHGTASAPTVNAAEVSNKGVELSLSWNDKVGDFSYGATFNYTHVKNNIDKFKGDDYSLSGYTYIKEGGSIGDMYMYKADRVIANDEDLAIVNDMLAKNPDAFKSLGRTPGLGDVLFEDVNGDGVINTDDRTIVGNTNPTDMLGLTINLGYKGFDFQVSMDGNFGYQGYLNGDYLGTTVSKDHQLCKYFAENAWREGKTSAKYPMLTSNGIVATSNYNSIWLQNRNYLKIRNIQLGYTIPKQLTKKVWIERFRIYGSLENFFTITKWKGIDPETDNFVYPTIRQAVIGVNVEF